MSHVGTFPIGRVDVGQIDAFSTPVADNFKRQTGAAVGVAGVIVGTAAKGGRLYRLMVQNAGATPYYLQVHDKASAPVNGNVPIYMRRLPASSEVELDLTNIGGEPCPLGVTFAISSTAATLTLAVANDIAFYKATYAQKA